jgi:pilus assembly protein Flp/PilA
MARIFSKLNLFGRDEDGATSIEYALIAGIVSISIVLALTTMKTELSTTFNKVSSELKSNAAN